MPDDTLGELIEIAYDAVFNPEGWSRLLDSLLDTFDLGGGFLRLYDRSADQWMTGFGVDSEAANGILDEYLALSCESPHAVRMDPPPGLGLCALSQDLVPDRVLEGSAVYNEVVRPRGLVDDAGVWVPVQDALELRAIFYKVPGSPGCGRDGVRVLQQLASHLARATKVQLSLQQKASTAHALQGCLERLGQGVILTDGSGRVVWANSLAEQLLRAPDSGLSVRQEKLYCRGICREATERLHALLARATTRCNGYPGVLGGSMALRRRLPLQPLAIHVVPLRAGAPDVGASDASAALFVSDHTAPIRVREGLLGELFGLTPAEARVAHRLASGETPKEIAAALGVSVLTVRNQLVAAFAKTGTSRQSELVRTVLLHSLSGR